LDRSFIPLMYLCYVLSLDRRQRNSSAIRWW